MPSIEDEIATWLNGRPNWMKALAEHVLTTGSSDDEFIQSLATDLITKKKLVLAPTFTASSLPTSSNTGSKVELLSISNPVNVNALADGGTLTFGESGLTVIYGDNGSGKSGYARLVKELVGARHRQEILPNAFNPAAPKEQSASINYRVNGQNRTLLWPRDTDSELTQIHFYDEACGDVYLVSDTELSYRPSALNVLDTLVSATDKLRGVLNAELIKIDTPKYEIPSLQHFTKASQFVASISADTPDEQIDTALIIPEDADSQLATLIQEEARLQSTNPTKEKRRLEIVAEGLDSLAEHFDKLEAIISPEAALDIDAKMAAAHTLRSAADVASKTSFTNEPLDGIGSESWRVLWEAAEAYSQQEAYHEHDFPNVDEGAVCPLCQQEIGTSAASRLKRFKAFIHDETAKKAKDAERIAQHAIEALKQLEISTVATTNALTLFEVEQPKYAAELRAALVTAEAAKKRIGKRLRKESSEDAISLDSVDTDALRTEAQAMRQRAEKIDASAFALQIKSVTDKKDELKDAIELSKHSRNLKKDAARMRAVRDLTTIRNSISTQPITKQSIELTRTHVNEVVNDRFSRESDRLGLERVKLDDKGGGKGKLRHKPALLGATLATKTVRDILSEGEQTALGLAGLLTEVNFDISESTLILDDPITSLDHDRREKVAKQVASLASKRQVIVFTHDLTFLGDLVRAANEEGIALLERSIIKDRADRTPGHILETHPWKAKDAKKRIGDLRERLAKLKKELSSLSSDEADQRIQLWAGHLSETLERIIRNDIVGKVVDRGTTEVRPRMVKLLAQITPEDDTEFQSMYSQVSKWAPRHDKSEEANFITPTIDEMENELSRVDTWYKKISSYEKN